MDNLRYPKSIMQDWACFLGLRHQGALVVAMRGCDTAPKEAGNKTLVRYMRSVVLNAFVGDPRKSASFISVPENEAGFRSACDQFFAEMDALPHHYVMHMAHAAEVIGYHHPGPEGVLWRTFYERFCIKMHLNAETKAQLDARLNADEKTFGAAQHG